MKHLCHWITFILLLLCSSSPAECDVTSPSISVRSFENRLGTFQSSNFVLLQPNAPGYSLSNDITSHTNYQATNSTSASIVYRLNPLGPTSTAYLRMVDGVVEITSSGTSEYLLRYANGSVEWTTSTGPSWIEGSYIGLSGGLGFYCGLRSNSSANCFPATNFPGGSPATLFDASTGLFKQLAASTTFTCGILLSGIVYCGGNMGTNPPTWSSNTSYVHIAAFTSDASQPSVTLFLGITADGRFVSCVDGVENVLMSPPSSPGVFWRYAIPSVSTASQSYCALRSDGFLVCTPNSAVSGDPTIQLSQFAITQAGSVGISSIDSTFVNMQPGLVGARAYTPLLFVVVDATFGNDTNCQVLNLATTTSLDTPILPCSSISAAVQLVNGTNNVWIHMRPGVHQLLNLYVPIAFITFSINLPQLPLGTGYVFPSSLNVSTTRVTWDCMWMNNCIRGDRTALWIEGVSFRNVRLHAVSHVGVALLPIDMFLSQVDCQNSGGLLFKTVGNVLLNRVQLINATNFPTTPGFTVGVGLVHIDNANVVVRDSEFRLNRINGSFLVPAATFVVVSKVGPTSFVMNRTIFESNFIRNEYSQYYDSTKCNSGPSLTINASDISVAISSSIFRHNSATGLVTCGIGVGVYGMADLPASHVVDIDISSSIFWNNSHRVSPKVSSTISRGAGCYVSGDNGVFNQKKIANNAPTLRVNNCTFLENVAYTNAGMELNRVHKAQISNSNFTRNGGASGSGFALRDGYYSFTPQPNSITNCIFDSNESPAISLETNSTMNIKGCIFRNQTSQGGVNTGGGISMKKIALADTNPTLTIDSCQFIGNRATSGGGFGAAAGTITVTKSTFIDGVSLKGGASYFTSATVKFTSCTFIRNVASVQFVGLIGVRLLEGGAVFAVSSSVTFTSCKFYNNSAQPVASAGLQSCQSVSGGTAMAGNWRGGAISLRETSLTLSSGYFDGSVACSGADIYADGNSVYIVDADFRNSRSFVGGSVAIKDVNTLFIDSTAFTNVQAISHAGALSFSAVAQFIVSSSTFENVSSNTGDGGIFYIAGMDALASNVAFDNTFTNCGAPLGGGAIVFFSALYGGAVQSFGFTDDDANIIIPPAGKYVQWGEHEATNVVLITSSVDTLTLYPGQPFDDDLYATPVNISILAIDGFNQTVRGNRGMVVQCTVSQADGKPIRAALLSGTVLQQMTDVRAAAVFNDLTLSAEPGSYQFTFAVVGSATIAPITISVTVSEDCPSGLFYSRTSATCTSCPNELLVYDPMVESCVPCPIGRVITPSKTCQICPLGTTNYGSSDCVACGSNTYQPTPLALCLSCLEENMEGLDCRGGIPQVKEGYFAFSLLDEVSSTPSLQTVQCPEGYCTSSYVQANWTDPSQQFLNNSASTIVPVFTSAVTRFDQCQYPRLVSEDNYLCGQCEPPLIVWGDKCSDCDKIESGRLVLFFFLTFGLVIFLVRSSLASASAGHTTIVLYFIQTAMLEVGSSSNLIGWLKVGLLSPSSFSDCIAPLSVYEQSVFQLLMPLVLLAELGFLMTLHYMWYRCRDHTGANSKLQKRLTERGIDLSGRVKSNPSLMGMRFLAVVDAFSLDLYVSASLSILLFTYTQVMVAAFSVLGCVDVAGVSVVFTSPTMRCDSDEYKRHMVLVGFVIAYLGLFPLSVFLFLWRRRSLVELAHAFMNRQAADAAMAAAPVLGDDGVTRPRKSTAILDSSTNDSAPARFLLRYSPLFSMYSSRAYLWQVVVLCRRCAFVSVSVSLVRKPNLKFLAFALSHLTSLVLQVWFRPFSKDFFNAVEVCSHLILILLSQSLTAVMPPYSSRMQAYLFCLVVPPLIIYAIVALIRVYFKHRDRREIDEKLFANGHRNSNAVSEPIERNHVGSSSAAAAVEMSDVKSGNIQSPSNGHTDFIPSTSVPASPLDQVLPEYVMRSEQSLESEAL